MKKNTKVNWSLSLCLLSITFSFFLFTNCKRIRRIFFLHFIVLISLLFRPFPLRSPPSLLALRFVWEIPGYEKHPKLSNLWVTIVVVSSTRKEAKMKTCRFNLALPDLAHRMPFEIDDTKWEAKRKENIVNSVNSFGGFKAIEWESTCNAIDDETTLLHFNYLTFYAHRHSSPLVPLTHFFSHVLWLVCNHKQKKILKKWKQTPWKFDRFAWFKSNGICLIERTTQTHKSIHSCKSDWNKTACTNFSHLVLPLYLSLFRQECSKNKLKRVKDKRERIQSCKQQKMLKRHRAVVIRINGSVENSKGSYRMKLIRFYWVYDITGCP